MGYTNQRWRISLQRLAKLHSQERSLSEGEKNTTTVENAHQDEIFGKKKKTQFNIHAGIM